MTGVLGKLSTSLARKDMAPNEALARELAATGNRKDLDTLAQNLTHPDKNLRYDCLKVLYETSVLNPSLAIKYLDDFAGCLGMKGWMMWGGMIAISTLSKHYPEKVYHHLNAITEAMDKGSVIATDHGVSILADLCRADKKYNKELFPLLLYRLRVCPAKAIPQYAEKTLAAVGKKEAGGFREVISERWNEMSGRQQERAGRVLKKLPG